MVKGVGLTTQWREFSSRPWRYQVEALALEQAAHSLTPMCLRHQAVKLVAALQGVAEVTAGLAEKSNGSLPPGLWRDLLHVTCALTACTLGSAPGPTLGNEYGRTVPFFTI